MALLIVLIEAAVTVILASYKTCEKIIELEIALIKWLIKNSVIYARPVYQRVKEFLIDKLSEMDWYQDMQSRRAYKAYVKSGYSSWPKP